jgi:hypothetical protein
MAETLKWDHKRKQQEIENTKFFLHIMTVGQKGDEYTGDPRDSA